jgi:putative ATP-dependent endonuclease of the OLD family
VLRKTRLHLDASRSATLFAERLLLVEGVPTRSWVR